MLFLLALLLPNPPADTAQIDAAQLDVAQIDAAKGVLRRVIGARATEFRLELMAQQGSTDAFTVEAKGGRVAVRGTSGVAICRGAYEYLKTQGCMVSWEGSNIHLPKRLPDMPRLSRSSPARFRHYYNICTFGYTTAFWDWKRWEREIDWMALHGINMPLAMTGQDKVWRTVFRSYGVPGSSIDKFFSGPAFQPWHWMGNLNGHMGPTPQSWLDGQAALQKQILARERSLGMRPVVPGFSGFVPVDFDRFVPGLKLDSPTAWAGFEPTKFVDVRDPRFVEIGARFVREYRKEFGSDHLYLCDTFNEQNPQFPAATKLQDLAAAGAAVYEGLRRGDPDAVWVMQGWLFYNERSYWKEPEIAALLSRVPNGRMMILDLSGEQYEVWRASPAVAKKGFIYNTLHNFGQNTALGGDLQGYLDRQTAAGQASRLQAAAGKPALLGFGLTPEGIDQNPVVYELMTDAMWSPAPDSASAWLDRYVRGRYGLSSPGLKKAWGLLHEALYSKDSPWFRDAWRGRPGRGRRGRPLAQMAKIEEALRLLLEAAGARLAPAPRSRDPRSLALAANPLFQRDVVDVAKTWMGGLADRMALHVTQTYGESPAMAALLKGDFFDVLNDLDRLLACRPEHRLSTWLAQAKSWGRTPEEKRLMERNARMQVTAWDGKGVLTDYANKEWAGLTLDFIARRWKLHFDRLGEGKNASAAEMLKLEMDWVNGARAPEESGPGDAVTVARDLLEKYRGIPEELERRLGVADPPGNLARMGKASDDGHTEPGGSAANAIDGDLDTYWAASPSPCQWRLDLGAVKPIRVIHVFPYWGDGRHYQYTVEASSDGQTWTQVVDMSRNEEESSLKGHRHEVSANARFLRINMLKNSANIGVHLVEVRVF